MALGGATNNVSINGTGKLKFAGTGVYQVGGNKYAFQLSVNLNYALFFNTTLGQYEFRDAAAHPVQSIQGNGNAVINCTLKLGAYPNFTLSGAGIFRTTGSSGTNPATNFIGTTDVQSFVLRTNNLEAMRLLAGGKVGIGTTTPNSRLQKIVATGEDALRVQVNGNTRFLVNDAGGVTIGSTTEAPANSLYVNGDVGIGIAAPKQTSTYSEAAQAPLLPMQIRHHIPATAASAQIIVTNTFGSTVKTFVLTDKGAGNVTINAIEHNAGSYYYTLIVDGKKADSKQMILIK